MTAIKAYVLAYPVVLPLAFLGTWAVGWFSLGYWPRPSIDDPKQIGAWVDIHYNVTLVLLAAGLPAFAIGILALICCAYRSASQRLHLCVVSSVATVCMVGTILMLRWDPLGAVAWFMD